MSLTTEVDDDTATNELFARMFDRGIGDLAVIRTGAQALDEGVVFGS